MLQKNQQATVVALKMNPEMDTSNTRVPLQEAAKIFEAGLKSKTWDIHGIPQFIMTTHCEGCKTCNAYAVHIVKASESLMVEIVGAYMLISIYAQGQSKYIFRFSLILFFYHIPFTVRIL